MQRARLPRTLVPPSYALRARSCLAEPTKPGVPLLTPLARSTCSTILTRCSPARTTPTTRPDRRASPRTPLRPPPDNKHRDRFNRSRFLCPCFKGVEGTLNKVPHSGGEFLAACPRARVPAVGGRGHTHNHRGRWRGGGRRGPNPPASAAPSPPAPRGSGRRVPAGTARRRPPAGHSVRNAVAVRTLAAQPAGTIAPSRATSTPAKPSSSSCEVSYTSRTDGGRPVPAASPMTGST